MLRWFRDDPVSALLYILAIPSTVILILQTVMLLFGLGHGEAQMDSDTSGLDDGGFDADDTGDGSDADVDHDGDVHDTGLRLFTVRGMVAFFSVGGWSGIAARQMGASALVAIIASLMMGALALYVVALFFKWVLKLQHNGTMQPAKAVGSIAEVYLTIPANASGSGKVNVILQEQLTELDAITYCDRALRSGEKVRVTGTMGESTLLVEPVGATNE